MAGGSWGLGPWPDPPPLPRRTALLPTVSVRGAILHTPPAPPTGTYLVRHMSRSLSGGSKGEPQQLIGDPRLEPGHAQRGQQHIP